MYTYPWLPVVELGENRYSAPEFEVIERVLGRAVMEYIYGIDQDGTKFGWGMAYLVRNPGRSLRGLATLRGGYLYEYNLHLSQHPTTGNLWLTLVAHPHICESCDQDTTDFIGLEQDLLNQYMINPDTFFGEFERTMPQELELWREYQPARYLLESELGEGTQVVELESSEEVEPNFDGLFNRINDYLRLQ